MEAFDFDDWAVGHDEPTENPLLEVVPTVETDPREIALQELNAKVELLRLKVTGFDTEIINPASEALTHIHTEQTNAKKVYQQLLDELNRQYSERQTELYKARNERRYLQDELDRMQREHSNLLKSMQTEKILSEIESKIDHLIMDSPWGIHARPYQLTDLKYMLAAFETGKTGVLNANPTGLGKTFETIIFDYCLQSLFPAKYDRMPLALWVTTTSLIKQTVREIKRWNPGRKVIPIEGNWNKATREYWTNHAISELAMVVVNYEQMNTNDVLMNTEWDLIYCDEVSRLKGGANVGKPTKVWTNMQSLLWETTETGRGIEYTTPYDPTPRAKFFVPLSGTPIQNKPGDMWAYLHLFMPTKFPKLKNFEREYAYGWPEIPVKFDRLINVMADQVIRQNKREVLAELPDKIREPRDIDMTPAQRKLYESMKNNFFVYLDANGENNISATVVIAWIIRLWQIALFPGIMKIYDGDMKEIPVECRESGILDEAVEIVEQTLAEDEKIVVWSSWFNEPLWEMKKRIEEKFKVRCEVVCGDTTKQSDDYIQSFQSDEKDSVQVLCINMKSGGYGLNLQNSSTSIMLDRWWNPATQEQAEDRQWRMGQKNAVIVHQMHAVDSVYDFVLSKVQSKEEMAEAIMNSKELKKASDWKKHLGEMI